MERLMTPSGEKGISTELCRALVDRILASASFSRSDRLSKFLMYAFQKTSEGRLEELSEYQIGLNVFGRSDRYSPGEDSIVRSHARLLRQRLDTYFASEGKAEAIRVTVPKGSYSLHFAPCQPETAPIPAAPTVQEPVVNVRSRWVAALVVLTLGGGVMACGIMAWILHPASPVDSVWKRVFAPNTRTIIVPADSTLALFEDLTNEVVTLSDYLNRNYHNHAGASEIGDRLFTSGRRYTSMADLQISTRLMRLPEAQSKEIVIRYARDLQMADLKGSNCVLLGGVRANPWQEVFQDKLNFRIGYDPERRENRVINGLPRKGESNAYSERSDSSYHRAYGIMALLPSLSSDTSVVIIQGTSTAGTEAAADFLFDKSRFEQFLLQNAAGTKRPFFEVLLQAESVGGNAQRATIIASRVISPPSP